MKNLCVRVKDKANGVVVLVMQRLHVGNLTGHLIKQGGCELLSLSAMATATSVTPSYLPSGQSGVGARRGIRTSTITRCAIYTRKSHEEGLDQA